MIGLGTIVNTIAIVAGGLGGLVSRRFLKERYQETVTKAIGFAIMMMALGSTLSQMLVVRLSADEAGQLSAGLDTQGTMMMVVSLAGGALLGELLDLEHWFERFGAWLRDETGSQGDRQFIDAFVSASLTVCIGAMACMVASCGHDYSKELARLRTELQATGDTVLLASDELLFIAASGTLGDASLKLSLMGEQRVRE